MATYTRTIRGTTTVYLHENGTACWDKMCRQASHHDIVEMEKDDLPLSAN